MGKNKHSPFAASASDRVSSIGEEKLIERIRGWLGGACPPAPAGIGDDCAVVRSVGGLLLVTVDPLIYRRHFDETVSARAAGEKLLKRNLSDIAAMGGIPSAAVVALSIDRKTSLRWLGGFYRGLAAAARRHRTAIVGGDVSEVPGVVGAGLTLIGRRGPGRVLTRTGARAGDSIFVTGLLGGSRPSGHHHRFEPRLAEGAWLSQQPGVRAMIDVSDGLAKDLRPLTPAGCAPAIDASAVPRRRGVSLAAALTDGEDYELLFAISGRTDRAGFLRRWRRQFPRTPLACIGRFARANRLPAGAIDFRGSRGFSHL